MGPYLYTVAYHEALKEKKTHRTIQGEDGMEPTPTTAKGPAQEAILNEESSIIDAALADLPRELQATIILACVEKRTHHEAAAALGIPRRTFDDRLKRARESLRKGLARRGADLSKNRDVFSMLAAPALSSRARPPSSTVFLHPLPSLRGVS